MWKSLFLILLLIACVSCGSHGGNPSASAPSNTNPPPPTINNYSAVVFAELGSPLGQEVNTSAEINTQTGVLTINTHAFGTISGLATGFQLTNGGEIYQIDYNSSNQILTITDTGNGNDYADFHLTFISASG